MGGGFCRFPDHSPGSVSQIRSTRHPLSLDEIHFCEKIWVLNRQAGADLNDRAPDFCKELSDRLDEASKKADADRQHPPPDGFRGVEWNSGILSFQRLRDTVFKGCDTMVAQKISVNCGRPIN
jgi:hypothetical protein